MGKRIDLTGKRFGRLVVQRRVGFRHHNTVWECLCDCGNTSEVSAGHLKTGDTKSCGCYYRERIKVININHGLRRHKLYMVWADMLQRCKNPNRESSKHYHERGISVCERWKDSFENFLEDMGPRPDGYTLERINTNGDYEFLNCKWATRTEQSRNSRRSKVWTVHGKRFESSYQAGKYFNVTNGAIRIWCGLGKNHGKINIAKPGCYAYLKYGTGV